MVAGSSTRHTRARRQLGNNNKMFPCDWFKGEPLISAPLYLDLALCDVDMFMFAFKNNCLPSNLFAWSYHPMSWLSSRHTSFYDLSSSL